MEKTSLKMKNKIFFSFLILLCIIVCLSIIAVIYNKNSIQQLISPYSHNQKQFPKIEIQHGNKIVYGFLPFWTLNKTDFNHRLSHLAYFALNIDQNGDLLTHEGKNLEPGFNKYQSSLLQNISHQINQQNGKFIIVIKSLDNTDFRNFILNKQSIDNLNKTLDQIFTNNTAIEGLNLDFEYYGEVTEEIRNNYAYLVKNVKKLLDNKYSDFHYSICMYASAAQQKQIWDIASIEPYVDHIIVMAYDYHRSNSTNAGPVAPIYGSPDLWKYDIHQNIKKFLQIVPANKIVFGLPFYGYQWETNKFEPQATSIAYSGSMITHETINNLLQNENSDLTIEKNWHDQALSPYLYVKTNDTKKIIYYDDANSLKYKLDLVNQLNFAGIAIWALGYEEKNSELWQVVNDNLP